jgi:ATP:corrinoid adenosyltransferase
MALGLLMIYTGRGDRTLPVMGQIFRALGRGLRVRVVTFRGENSPYSNLIVPEKFRDALAIHALTIRRETTDALGDPHNEARDQVWKSARELIDSVKSDMVVLDELQLLLTDNAVSSDEVADYLGKCRETLFVLVTTDKVPEQLATIADLITEVTETVRTE